ncbi:MAG: hypothetical protein L6R40_000953 [Gallowayella cf. fulva]|nr:MAG: hypothetical protein L6R40_000953 [Xanthomendoza cf. fulva]
MEPGTLNNHEEGDYGSDHELRRQKSSGSVKRARQRAAAGLPSEHRDPLEPAPLRITPNRTPPRAVTPAEQTPSSQSAFEATTSPQVSSSTPQQQPSPTSSSTLAPTIPNWPPVPFPASAEERPNSPGQSPRQNGKAARGPPPKRPPRPDYVPPLSNDTPDQQPRNYWEGGFIPPPTDNNKISGRPGAGVPEFPVPFTTQAPPQPRRNLGPPPSARKGGANFYPQNAFVAPIPEEQSEAHSSFASSHVMPSSWGDGPPEYYTGSGISEEDEDEIHSPSSTNDGRDSRAGDHDESTGLVRKVSIGKPGKPALKPVKDSAGIVDEHSKAGQEVQFGPGAGVATFLAPSSNNNSPVGTPREKAALYDNNATRSHSGTASSSSPVDPRVAKILGGLEKGGALSTAATSPMTSKTGSMSEKGGRRPPRLKLEAVKETEPRGSATSLPELIRRATRLASNLDRGKTASRIGMLEILEKERSRQPSRSGSISDILAAFPSPSLATPTGDRGSPRFPSPLARSGLHIDYTATPDHSEYGKRYQGRRCCGLPIWAFILLCIILLLLIAAAIIIPITLIVLPRQNSNSGRSADGCKRSFPCSNGGTSVLEGSSCRCICMNGFTGAFCNIPADSGCTTANIKVDQSSYQNATVGTSITRLINSAKSNYSISLDPSIVLSKFSSQNLTCTSQNALVTFNGKPQRRRRDYLTFSEIQPRRLMLDETLNRRHPTPASILDARAIANRAAPAQAAVTSNGLVYAAPMSPEPPSSSASNSSPSTLSQPSSSASSSNSSTTNKTSTDPNSRPLTPNILDFARIAILFILQERDLAIAVDVQQAIQTIFSPAVVSTSGSGGSGGEGNFNASAANVGIGIKVNWARMTVDFGNGTEFGGRGEG